MVDASTPWVARTTKRQPPISAPTARKRQRTIEKVEDGPASIRRKPRQQTLTQIQFVPHRPQDDQDDDLKPIVTVPRRASAKHNGVKRRKSTSTLTQMDFVARSALGENQEGDFIPTQDSDVVANSDSAVMQLDGAGDTPNPRRKRGTPLTETYTSKRKATRAVSEESEEFVPAQKKRKSGNGLKEDDIDPGRRTSKRMASVKATRSIGLLSATAKDSYDENMENSESPSIRPNVSAPRTQGRRALLQQSFQPALVQESQPPSPDEIPRTILPRTPSKHRNVIPSSQSPEGLLPSAQRIIGPDLGSSITGLARSPLKERSVNIRTYQRKRDLKASSPDALKGHSPPKRKICALKIPRQSLRQDQTTVETNRPVSKHTIWSPPSSSPRVYESDKPAARPVLEMKSSAQATETIPSDGRSLQAPTFEVKDIVADDVPEIPGTSPVDVRRDTILGHGDAETLETLPHLRDLLGMTHAADNGVTLHNADGHEQPQDLGNTMEDFAVGQKKRSAHRLWKASMEKDEPPSVPSPDVVSVADSEDEGSVLALSIGSSIANDTQFNAELAQRIPTSSTEASLPSSITPTRPESLSPSLQLDREIEHSLPHPSLTHHQSTNFTTQIVPLNDTSSPSLPPRPTQRTVYPASLPRPSQVSTQDPTQPYLPMSSLPLQSMSSPVKSGPTTITIKESSSPTRPLREIPSQTHSQSQSQLNIDLGLDDCLDVGDDDGLDEALAAMSDEVEDAIAEEQQEEESQIVPLPRQSMQNRTPGNATTTTTEAGSPVRRRRPRKPVIPPEVRALLGETFLESPPGPPGWSQRSWDDEPL